MELFEKSSNIGDDMLNIVSKIKGDKDAFAFYKEAQPHLMALEVSSYDASESIVRLTKIEEEAYENGINDVEISELKKSLFAVIEGNNDIRRRFGLKFKSLASKLIDTPTTVGDINYQFDKVADDETVKNFEHYYKLFCMYRYEFGKLAADIEPYLLYRYKDEHETHSAYHVINESMNTKEPITFTFKLHKYRPYELSLKDLDAFQDNVKACMDVFYHMYKCIDINDLLNPDVVRDGIGRIKERTQPSNLFKHWERCLLAFELSKNMDLTLNEIGRKSSGAIRKLDRKFKDDVDAASAAKKDIAEAQRLIASASKGTFPN